MGTAAKSSIWKVALLLVPVVLIAGTLLILVVGIFKYALAAHPAPREVADAGSVVSGATKR
jgi:hypothetical protein